MLAALAATFCACLGTSAAHATPGGPGGQHDCTPAEVQYMDRVMAHITTPDGSVVDVCANEMPSLRLGPELTFQIWPDVPRSASSALVNLTMVDGLLPGYVTANTCSALRSGPPSSSSGNHGVATAVAALAVVPLDGDGGFCVHNQSEVNVLADVQGYFSPADDGLGFVSVPSARVLDTRAAPAQRPHAAAVTRVGTGLPAGTAAAVVNLTTTNALSAGFITAGPCTTLSAATPSASSGNFAPGTDSSNLSVVALDPDGVFCVYNSAPVDLVIDVQGAFTGTSTRGFESGPAMRRLDTRLAPSVRPGAGSVTRVTTGVAPSADAVLANLTMTGASSAGFITADRCSAFGSSNAPTKSSGNFTPASDIANLATVPVDADGSFCIYTSAPVDLVVDVQGAFSASGSQRFHPVTARRVADTRPTATYLSAPCAAGDLVATAAATGGLPAAENIEVILQNQSEHSCLINGTPQLAVLADGGGTTPLAVTYGLASGTTVHGARPIIGPGEAVEFIIGSDRSCGAPSSLVPHLLVTVPNGSSLPVDASTARPGGLNVGCGVTVSAFSATTTS